MSIVTYQKTFADCCHNARPRWQRQTEGAESTVANFKPPTSSEAPKTCCETRGLPFGQTATGIQNGILSKDEITADVVPYEDTDSQVGPMQLLKLEETHVATGEVAVFTLVWRLQKRADKLLVDRNTFRH
jgi:hypothetical protein